MEREAIAVLGAGTMGAGIARVFADAGHDVRVFDVRPEAAAMVAERVGTTACRSVAEAVRGATLVLEAAPESLDAKRALLAEIEAANVEALILTNTSSLDPAELAGALADPSRLLVAHWFNPANTVPLVEVVPGPASDPAAVERVTRVLEAAGKVAVPLARAVPGFVANRLQAALYREAMHLVESGVATPEQVDACVTAGLGPRWAIAGPFEVMDLGGLDVWQAVSDGLFGELGDAGRAPAMLRERVARGDLGAKTGRGFAERSPSDARDFADRLRRLLAALDAE